MTDVSARKFRDYATRVSFNLTLTRNQIYVIRTIREECARPISGRQYSVIEGRDDIRGIVRASMNMPGGDMWVPGVRRLSEMGLVEYHDPSLMKPTWSEHVWRLTPAGEHVCRLLEVAGLIPALATVTKRRARVA